MRLADDPDWAHEIVAVVHIMAVASINLNMAGTSHFPTEWQQPNPVERD